MRKFKNLSHQPKYKPQQYITDGGRHSFTIEFVEYDFEREEYYYFRRPDTFAGKIYQSDAQLTDPPKSSAMEMYEKFFEKKGGGSCKL